MLKRFLGKILIIIGFLLVCGSAVYQVILLYREFGGLGSGYLIVDWSLLGVFGIVLFPIGKHIFNRGKNKAKKNEEEKKK